MRQSLLETFGLVFVERISVISQLVLLVAASATFYEARSHSSVSWMLRRLAQLERFARFGKNGFGVGSPSPEATTTIENFQARYVFASALAVALLVILSDRSLLHWLAYPFLQIAEAATVWLNLEWTWLSLLLPFASVAYLLWFLLSMFLIYGLGLAIIVRAIALASTWLHSRLSEASFHGLLFGVSVMAGVVLIAATTEWYPTN